MTCSRGSGPSVKPRLVKLTVYLRGPRTLSGEYTRNQAALRLKWARRFEEFKGYSLDAV